MRFLLFVLSVGLLTPLAQAEGVGGGAVYRWTDAQGQVHYGTRPPSGDATKVLTQQPEAISNDAKSEDARVEMRRKMLESFERDRQVQRQQQDQAKLESRRQLLRCKQVTRHWNNLNHYGPIYYQNAAGGRVFYSDEDREAERKVLRKKLKQYCGKVPDELDPKGHQ